MTTETKHPSRFAAFRMRARIKGEPNSPRFPHVRAFLAGAGRFIDAMTAEPPISLEEKAYNVAWEKLNAYANRDNSRGVIQARISLIYSICPDIDSKPEIPLYKELSLLKDAGELATFEQRIAGRTWFERQRFINYAIAEYLRERSPIFPLPGYGQALIRATAAGTVCRLVLRDV